MTRWRLKPSADGSALAIYSVPSASSTDDAPLTDPWNNKSRLQLHTSAILPSTTPALTQTVTINIPAIGANTKFEGASYRYQLFAHGLGAACMVEGRILNLGGTGVHVAFNGSVPVSVNTRGIGTWLALGSTSTHVVVEAFGLTNAAVAAQSYSIEASAYNFLETGSAPTSNPALPRLRHLPGSHTSIARGAVDTRRRYVRQTGTGPDFAIAAAETLRIIGNGGGSGTFVQNLVGWRWRYSVNGYIRQTTLAWDSTTTDGGTYNAPVIQVKR